jgi:hypothetical protein
LKEGKRVVAGEGSFDSAQDDKQELDGGNREHG